MKGINHKPTAEELVNIIRSADESQIEKLPLLIEAHALSLSAERNKELIAEIDRLRNDLLSN